jgi:1,4-alpha-glucan branching enzyme
VTPQAKPAGSSRIVTDYEAYLFGEGHWLRAWEKMGARPAEVDAVAGYTFVVWAPNGQAVSVVGDFNHWDGRANPLRNLGASGLWEGFIPGITEGTPYKFEIHQPVGPPLLKCDPFALAAEVPPKTASVTSRLTGYTWRDLEWMDARRRRGTALDAPLSIYEVHPGSWRRNPDEGSRSLTWRELATELVEYVTELGITHIELMPVMEHGVLRADQPLWIDRRFPVLRGRVPSPQHRRDSRLGAGALSKGRARACTIRRVRAVRA